MHNKERNNSPKDYNSPVIFRDSFLVSFQVLDADGEISSLGKLAGLRQAQQALGPQQGHSHAPVL